MEFVCFIIQAHEYSKGKTVKNILVLKAVPNANTAKLEDVNATFIFNSGA
jgi:hypothetical protein